MQINKPKIFISHSWEDKPLVRRLEIDLKSAGTDVWIDHSETRGGDNLPERISKALEWCDILLLVWSETAESSRWVELEWTNAIALGKRVIPCILGNNELPAILANKIYIDFYKYEAGLNQLLRSFNAQIAVKELGSRQKHEATRPLQHLPYRSLTFTGRQEQLENLENGIRNRIQNGLQLGFWGLRGMGGIGKSALAAEMAERFADEVDLFPGGILWTNQLDEPATNAAARWLRAYGIETKDLSETECVERFHATAKERRPFIVIDNVQNEKAANTLLVRAKGVVNLLTTRDQQNIPSGVNTVRVDQLSETEAITLLETLIGDKIKNELEVAKQVCAQCGYLPLFLNIAGKAISSDSTMNLKSYSQALAKRGLSGFAEHDVSALVVFDHSYERLEKVTKEIFSILALFPGEHFGSNFVQAWLGCEDYTARSVLARLENASLLLTAQPGRYRFHDRVRDYALGKLDNSQEVSAKKRLIACWTNWDMIVTELKAVGPFELISEYDSLISEHDDPIFDCWKNFVRNQAYVLDQFPELFFQQALNQPRNSPVSLAAQHRVANGQAPERWLEWINRPKDEPAPGCVHVLKGHVGIVFDLAVDQMGMSCVTVCTSLRLWELQTGKCLRDFTLEGHEGIFWSVAMTGLGDLAVSGSDDNTVCLWNLKTGDCLHVFEGHSEPVTSVAISNDGALIVSGSKDNTVRIWDARKGTCLHILSGHAKAKAFRTVFLSKDTNYVASGSGDGTILIWNTKTGQLVRKIVVEGNDKWEEWDRNCVLITSDGKSVIQAGLGSNIRFWSIETGECVLSLDSPGEKISCISLSADEKFIISGTENGIIRIWDVETQTCRQIFRAGGWPVRCAFLIPFKHFVISAGGAFSARVWDLSKLPSTLSTSMEGLYDKAFVVQLSNDSRYGITNYRDNGVRIWDIEKGACIQTLQVGERVFHAAICPQQRYLVAGTITGKIYVWELITEKQLFILKGHDETCISDFAFSRNNDLLISSSYDKSIRVWSLENGECLRVLQGHSGRVICLSMSKDGKMLISGDGERKGSGLIRVWDFETGNCTRILDGHPEFVILVNISDDSNRIVSQSHTAVKVWETSTGDCIESHERDSDGAVRALSSVQSAPTFAYLRKEVFAADIYSTASQTLLGRFPAEVAQKWFSFSSDGRRGIICDRDGTVYILHLMTPDLFKELAKKRDFENSPVSSEKVPVSVG